MSRVEQRLRFERDGTVTALSGKMEYGQGLRASYPRIVAEELGISPSRVGVVLGDTDLTPWDMGTFGSMSVEMDGAELRRAAAFARSELIRRAAAHWGCTPAEVEIGDAGARFARDARAVSFAELLGDAPLTGEVPEDTVVRLPMPTCADGPSMGSDAVALVTGRLEFAGDVRLPGMLHGAVLHPAVHDAVLGHVDREAAMAVPGVVAIVAEPGFTGVVAERPEQAAAGRAALNAQWLPLRTRQDEPMDAMLRDDPQAAGALKAAPLRVVRRYFTPHVAGAPLGPSVGLADVRLDGAVVYGTTQVPFRLREEVARMAGVAPERVHYVPKAMSGGFGRHGSSDAAVEAARLSKAVGRPVRVQWGRADELRAGPNRPEMTTELEAGLVDGRIRAWRSDIWTNPYTYDGAAREGAPRSTNAGAGARPGGAWSSPAQMGAMMAGRNAIPPYDIGQAAVALHVRAGEVRTGALRSLGAAPNVFAIESFVDELAHEVGSDPIAFRLAHTADLRLTRVLEAVRDLSGWAAADRPKGFGVACVQYRRTYVAEVVQVSVTADGTVRLERVWCAVDPGHVVHPDGARNQVEGAVQMAAGWALLEELPRRGGEVTGTRWADYPVPTFRDAPRAIDVVFTGDDRTPSAGLGEPPAVPIPAAIANAVFDACGARMRELPIRPDAVAHHRGPYE